MSAHKHTPGTPGPWTPIAIDDGSWVIDNGFGYTVALVQNLGRATGSRDTEADARMIAAAPDLLESVKALLGCMSLAGWDGDPIAVKARAAIAKATGEPA